MVLLKKILNVILTLILICIIFREEKDLKVALELAERLSKKKHTHEVGVKVNLSGMRPGILKKQFQPESAQRYLI